MLPVGVEYFDDLRDVIGIVGDNAVVAGQREVFLAQVEGRDQCDFLVDHNRFFMRHVALGIGPLDRDLRTQKLLVGLVIGAVTTGRAALSCTRTSTPAFFLSTTAATKLGSVNVN